VQNKLSGGRETDGDGETEDCYLSDEEDSITCTGRSWTRQNFAQVLCGVYGRL
jgi:hypothetical protein